MKKAIIGIVAKRNKHETSRFNTFIRDEMKDALFDNGAIAIAILPTSEAIRVDSDNEHEIYSRLDDLFTPEEQSNMIAQIRICDGVILQGGNASDAYEIWIARYCYEHDIPMLAICAGQNNMVRAMGGTTKTSNNSTMHNKPNQDYVHGIKVECDSRFFDLIKSKKMMVNSRHKVSIDNPANLSVSAYDEDGNIEVVEDKGKACFIGIRFHPESLYKIDKKHNSIFTKFVQICEKNIIKKNDLDCNN